MPKINNRTYTPRYPAELRERGVRLVKEHRSDYGGDHAAYRTIVPKLGCSSDSLRAWCQQAERDAGQQPGLITAEKEKTGSKNWSVRTGNCAPPMRS